MTCIKRKDLYKKVFLLIRLFGVNERRDKECPFHKSSYASLKVSSKAKAMLLNHRQFIGIKLLKLSFEERDNVGRTRTADIVSNFYKIQWN